MGKIVFRRRHCEGSTLALALFFRRFVVHFSALLVAVVLAACGGSATEPAPTSVALVRQLVTIAPTTTPDEAQRLAAQQTAQAQVTPSAMPTHTPTPYVGVFLGEVEAERPIMDLAQFDVIPTRSAAAMLPLLCEIPVGEGFGTSWTTESRVFNGLGCPIQEDYGFVGTVQVFERGVMYFRPDTNELWAIVPGPSFGVGQYWYIDQPVPVTTEGLVPPSGRFVPEGVMGGIWATHLEMRSTMGYGITPPQDIDVSLQRFEGGTLFRDRTVGQVFALLVNGNAFGPY